MAVTGTDVVPVRNEQDIVLSRQQVRKLLQQLQFSLVDQTKMVTAASELARNTVKYGGGGLMRWETLDVAGRVGLRLAFEDQGPGIPDTVLAMTDGFTTGNGMGKGLPGSKRLVNEFDLQTAPGQGTTVTITRWK
jgi:serine/threonine-protein kinase RsbT